MNQATATIHLKVLIAGPGAIDAHRHLSTRLEVHNRVYLGKLESFSAPLASIAGHTVFLDVTAVPREVNERVQRIAVNHSDGVVFIACPSAGDDNLAQRTALLARLREAGLSNVPICDASTEQAESAFVALAQQMLRDLEGPRRT